MRKVYSLAILAVLSIFAYGCASTGRGGTTETADPLNPEKKAPRIYVGPVAGYNRSLHSGGFQSISGDANCPEFGQGTENGFYVGLSGEFLLGDPKNANSSIIARALYDYYPATFTVQAASDNYPTRNVSTGSTIETQGKHVTQIKYPLMNIEAMYRFNIPNTLLGFSIGPQFGIPIGGTQEQRYELVFDSQNPAQFIQSDAEISQTVTFGQSARYLDETKTSIVLYNGDVVNASGVRFGIRAGVQYEILLNRFILIPAAYYNLGLTKISNDINSTVSALQVGVDLRFAL